jgi:hypothetical protein
LHTTTPLAPSWKHLPFVDRFTLTLLVSLGEIDLRCCLVCGILGTRWEKLFSQVTPPPPFLNTQKNRSIDEAMFPAELFHFLFSIFRSCSYFQVFRKSAIVFASHSIWGGACVC